jgi:putative DNA methylase
MTYPVKSPRKLIEVALPLDAINEAAAREKSIRHGHPSTLHLWWARRPLAAARAVIFAQMVNDPSWKWEMEHPGEIPPNHLKASWAASRKRLFKIIEELVLWENTTNEEVLERARAEIRRSWREVCELNKDHPQAAELFNPDKLPALHDPFAGGGSIPLEAQRLGLEAYASDLNPVAVLINKAMIEIPPKFANRPPVNPEARGGGRGAKKLLTAGDEWKGAQGLAEDVRYYGRWMRDEAEKRIGHLYPKVEITAEMARERPDLKSIIGMKLTGVAWLWVRTVKSPNPGFSHVDVPLASTFVLSSREGKEVYVQPVVEGDRYRFAVKIGTPPQEAIKGTSAGKRAAYICLVSGTPIDYDYIKNQGRAGRIGVKLMAVVADGPQGRVYLPPTEGIESVAFSAKSTWHPQLNISGTTQFLGVISYGLTKFADLFTERQLAALATFSELVTEARLKVCKDAVGAGLSENEEGIEASDCTALGYAEAVSVYLACAVSRASDYWVSLATWEPSGGFIGHLFTKQAIPMIWDFAEGNPFSDGTGSWAQTAVDWVVRVIEKLPTKGCGAVTQMDISRGFAGTAQRVFSTDPPYYDNVPYSDISDYFYVWLRRSMRHVYPEVFSTIAAPKSEELVAFSYRHADKQSAEIFFLSGMTRAMVQIAGASHPDYPITIYYAFKQTQTENDETASTGWDIFLDAVLASGLLICGTWPLRTERANRSRGINSNALASSIVLVCRKRPADAPTTSRRQFLRELNTVLPEALDEMTRGAGDERSPVAPVDLSQAIIGPGMAVFSKYAAVLEADGAPMSVRTALQLINRFLAEDDFDADTQFCLHWFDQYGWKAGPFGEADVLARAKGTSVGGVQQAGVIESGGGNVRLRKWTEYAAGWDPQGDTRNPVWETLHHLIRALRQEGYAGAGQLLAAVRGKGEATRQLAYRLYTLCEREGWAEDARAYNELITSWDGIEMAASSAPVEPLQGRLFS